MMALMIFDFQCEDCGYVEERFIRNDERIVECTKCHGHSNRLIPTPHFDYLHMGVDPTGNPTAGEKWAKMHEKNGEAQEE